MRSSCYPRLPWHEQFSALPSATKSMGMGRALASPEPAVPNQAPSRKLQPSRSWLPWVQAGCAAPSTGAEWRRVRAQDRECRSGMWAGRGGLSCWSGAAAEAREGRAVRARSAVFQYSTAVHNTVGRARWTTVRECNMCGAYCGAPPECVCAIDVSSASCCRSRLQLAASAFCLRACVRARHGGSL
jgi:hypothetical protein